MNHGAKVGLWGAVLALAAWGQAEAPPPVKAVRAADGQVDVAEAGRPVLRYNYAAVQPPAGCLEKVSAGNRKYAVPRGDYIHPLHGLDGEELTLDWSIDHPHHRGIYWAWPEVDWGGRRGDLHALQHVFARPTGQLRISHEKGAAGIEAENRWEWEDGTPIVREKAAITVHPSGPHGRYVDLRFELTALADGVKVARRGTKHYGGLNIRLSAWKDVRLDRFADPAGTAPRKAWSSATGAAASLAVLEKAANPDYPGDWITYKELPWFQPAFPAAGTRHEIRKDRPLVLEYRLWIRRAAATAEESAAAWKDYNRREEKP